MKENKADSGGRIYTSPYCKGYKDSLHVVKLLLQDLIAPVGDLEGLRGWVCVCVGGHLGGQNGGG